MHNWALATGHRGANIQHPWKIPLWWIRSITYRLTSPLPSWTRIRILRKWRDSIRSSVSPLWETRIHRNSESKKSMCTIFWLRCRWFLQVASILQGRVSERSLPFLLVALPVRSMTSQSRAWMTGLRIFSRSSVVSWIWDLSREATTNVTSKFWNNTLMPSTTAFLTTISFCLTSLPPSNRCLPEKLLVLMRPRSAKSTRSSSTCMTIDKARLPWSLPTSTWCAKIVQLTAFLNSNRSAITKNSRGTETQAQDWELRNLLRQAETEETRGPPCGLVG